MLRQDRRKLPRFTTSFSHRIIYRAVVQIAYLVAHVLKGNTGKSVHISTVK